MCLARGPSNDSLVMLSFELMTSSSFSRGTRCSLGMPVLITELTVKFCVKSRTKFQALACGSLTTKLIVFAWILGLTCPNLRL